MKVSTLSGNISGEFLSVLCWDHLLPFLSRSYPLVQFSDQCHQVQRHSIVVKLLLSFLWIKLWPLTSNSLPDDKWRTERWGVFNCDTPLVLRCIFQSGVFTSCFLCTVKWSHVPGSINILRFIQIFSIPTAEYFVVFATAEV